MPIALRFVVLWLAGLVAACTPTEGSAPAVRIDLPPGGITIGPPDAPVTVIEFGSFDCSFCRYLHQEVYPNGLLPLVDVGMVRWRYIDLSLTQGGRDTARALGCAVRERPVNARHVSLGFSWRERGVDAVVDSLDGGRGHVKSCLSTPGSTTIADLERLAAAAAGVAGTPTLVVGYEDEDGSVVGWPVVGVPSPGALAALLDSAIVLLGGDID